MRSILSNFICSVFIIVFGFLLLPALEAAGRPAIIILKQQQVYLLQFCSSRFPAAAGNLPC
jgi:hypothetical protein